MNQRMMEELDYENDLERKKRPKKGFDLPTPQELAKKEREEEEESQSKVIEEFEKRYLEDIKNRLTSKGVTIKVSELIYKNQEIIKRFFKEKGWSAVFSTTGSFSGPGQQYILDITPDAYREMTR